MTTLNYNILQIIIKISNQNKNYINDNYIIKNINNILLIKYIYIYKC